MILISDQLKAFIEVCEQGTVLGASKNLGLTQTGVTQRIQALERMLQVSLFIRSRKGMLKTSEGNELHIYCKNVQKLENESLSFLKDAESRRDILISICGPTSFLRTRVVGDISKVLKDHNNLRIKLDFDDFENRVKKLKEGQADFAIIRSSVVPKELVSKTLHPSKFILVGPKSWRKRSIIDIVMNERIIDFSSKDDMTLNYLKKFKLLKYFSKQRHYINNIESLIHLIEDEHGFGVLEESLFDGFISKNKVVILNDKNYLENSMSLCWIKKTIESKISGQIISSIS